MKWTVLIENVGEGGQGAISKIEFTDGSVGAKKSLHKDNSRNRSNRIRFRNEVEALRLLSNDGIPRVLQCNTEHWEDKDTELYFISEWVEGTRLGTWQQKTSPGITEATAVVCELLSILGVCHEAGILHRDIKPDNVMISDSQKVHLVDFGIAKIDGAAGLKTAKQVELGNRFLRLPEYSSGNHSFDETSDITQIVGILFFLITNTAPRILLDADGKMPHQRGVDFPGSPSVNRQLNRIFDIGFQHHKLRRFQSIQDLLALIDTLKAFLSGASEDPAMDEVDDLIQFFNSERVEETRRLAELTKTISDAYSQSICDLARKMNLACGGSGKNQTAGNYSINFHMVQPGTSNPKVDFKHSVDFANERIQLTVTSECFDAETYFESMAADELGLVDAARARSEKDVVVFARRLMAKLKKNE